MKYTLKHLQSLVPVALCAIFAVALSSCSKDDDEPATNDLSAIVVGVWAQDGDDDIMVFNANGTGLWYESPAEYEQKEDSDKFKWSVKGEWLTINLDYGDGSYDYELKCRPEKIVSKNKIIWRNYDIYDTEHYDLKDAFGYYRLWTWECYSL